MLHLAKLSVGTRDIAHLREMQAVRRMTDPPLRHRTRNFPRRADEIVDGGGSIFWVVAGAMVVRQRVTGIIEDVWDDGTACAAILLDPVLVPVEARLTKPFQGWRYLPGDDAPADLGPGRVAGGEGGLPPALRAELRALCLI